jgi:predicted nuclease of predicted toxin-antitoxin system
MRFLVDECTGPKVARWLRQQQYDIFSVYEEARGADDDWILQKARAENRIVITNDKDFGELIFREKKPHCGVILLRLDDEKTANKIAVLQNLLRLYGEYLAGSFVVATEMAVRIIR